MVPFVGNDIHKPCRLLVFSLQFNFTYNTHPWTSLQKKKGNVRDALFLASDNTSSLLDYIYMSIPLLLILLVPYYQAYFIKAHIYASLIQRANCFCVRK